MTIYIPHESNPEVLNQINMNYRDFSAICQEKGLKYLMDESSLQKKRGRFALVKPNESNFYILYLNVDQKNVAAFNYSLSSVRF